MTAIARDAFLEGLYHYTVAENGQEKFNSYKFRSFNYKLTPFYSWLKISEPLMSRSIATQEIFVSSWFESIYVDRSIVTLNDTKAMTYIS